MNKIIEAGDLPEGEKVYLKKDRFGYRVVEPWKNPDGKINWFNLLTGGKKNLIMLIVIVVILGLFYLGFTEMNSNYILIAKNPCSFCKDCQAHVRDMLNNMSRPSMPNFNISFVNGGDRGD